MPMAARILVDSNGGDVAGECDAESPVRTEPHPELRPICTGPSRVSALSSRRPRSLPEKVRQTLYGTRAVDLFRSVPSVSSLDRGCSINLVDGPLQNRIEGIVAHRYFQFIDQSPREAGNHAVVSGQACAGVGPRVAPGQGYHPDHARVLDQLRVEIRNVRDRQLEHYLSAARQTVQAVGQCGEQNGFRIGLLWALDRDFRLKDRHQSMLGDLRA